VKNILPILLLLTACQKSPQIGDCYINHTKEFYLKVVGVNSIRVYFTSIIIIESENDIETDQHLMSDTLREWDLKLREEVSCELYDRRVSFNGFDRKKGMKNVRKSKRTQK
jgi:hypothetical protein